MPSEADTRANFIDPALAEAGWGADKIIREHYFTAGRKMAGKLSQKKLNTIPVPLPPLEEQQRIVEHLDGLSSRIQTLEKTTRTRLDHLAALKVSLLDAAFRGNL
ncbi:restriction endonuclease subunit S [Pontiella sp.]|uniref:restriction endonuclease subunit S n=1 Tax=Pontiella sp. TaxID=2837462 RepID=UPI0035646FC0